MARTPRPAPPPGRLAPRWGALAAVGASLAVAVALGIPGEAVPRFGPVQEFGVHASAFGIAAALWGLARPRSAGWVLGVGLALAVGTEVLQEWVVPLRTGSVTDAAANAVGVVAGTASAVLARRRGPLRAEPGPRGPSR